jgi:hypothetical protein
VSQVVRRSQRGGTFSGYVNLTQLLGHNLQPRQDDLWRRNHDTISGLEKHASDFNPHYPTSIAYSPLPRAVLESFLAQRGLYHVKVKRGDFFHSGFLNKMYMRMYDIVYHGTRQVSRNPLHRSYHLNLRCIGGHHSFRRGQFRGIRHGGD